MAGVSSSSGEFEPKDSFLRAHYIAPFTYDLGGRFRPPAIRDQMIRARLLVDRAYEEGLFHGKPILIVGAGVAGVSVAFWAAKRGVKSVIAEEAHGAFGRFVLCSSRWVDPTQYDWPAGHWQSGRLEGLPLDYAPGWPSQLAATWRAQLQTLEAEHKTEVVYRLRIERNAVATHLNHVELVLRDGESPRAFDLAVYCEGPGTEDCRVGAYSGLEFFQDDPFEEPALGLLEGITPRVLISGCGDGALQDFIRIASGRRSAGELYQELFNGGNQDLERRVATAESQARRLLLWSSPSQESAHDHAAHSALRDFYQRLLLEMENDYAYWQSLRDRFRNIAGARLRDGRTVHVVHPCAHLSHCYPLNRFVARLVMNFLAIEDRERFRFIPNTGTAAVACVGHSRESAAECHGKSHLVSFAPLQCWGKSPGPGQSTEYNVVVVRHGVKRGGAPQQAVRQMLPYFLPAGDWLPT